ncbi:hypothetical protein DESPIGER_2150 [Desulfovibrio piger]|uniref:Uncharacterized protein n=1 Tax=Desulfovibrio piger TaxID=901 RepID=A0A1K1LGX6_9BACT|nr:hypothetical protein DESPIGER_2150 [Desulfovibrio piger]
MAGKTTGGVRQRQASLRGLSCDAAGLGTRPLPGEYSPASGPVSRRPGPPQEGTPRQGIRQKTRWGTDGAGEGPPARRQGPFRLG